MQELIEMQNAGPHSGKILITLDGDLGSSFMQYLVNEQASPPNEQQNVQTESMLETGIQGT